MGDASKWAYIIGIPVGIIALLAVILIPLSFSDLQYYQYGFIKRKSTGAVSLEKVYSSGRHFVGPDYEFKVFQADAHFEELTNIAIFSFDKLEIQVTCRFQYFLRKDDMPLLHDTYDRFYQPVIRTSAIDAIKGAAPQFNTRQYIGQRKIVEDTLADAVKLRLGGTCCKRDCADSTEGCVSGCKPYDTCTKEDKGLFVDVKYFQIGRVLIPNDVQGRFLLSLTQLLDAEQEQYLQDATIVRKETEAEVEQIENEAREISQNATAQSGLITSRANAQAVAVVEDARNSGLSLIYTRLGLSNDDHKASFNYIRTLRDHESVYMSVNYNTLISGLTATGGG
ncbi:uncharacterized protein [Branchiostoma lanceolatum]|uniref:uncharacterized protein n=1 Tax=Branchiostoma lanceolatum TaxID=7740 RepID=UPI00345242AF